MTLYYEDSCRRILGANGNKLIVNSDGSINIVGSISATNPSVGPNVDPIPDSATLIGWEDGSGDLQPVSATNPLPISGSFSASEPTLSQNGSASSAAVIFTKADTTGYYSCFFRITGIGTSTVVAEIQNPTDGTWNAALVAPAGTCLGQTSIVANGMYCAQTGGKGFRLRVSVYDGSATITADGFFRGFPVAVFPASQAISGTVSASNLPTTVDTNSGNKSASTIRVVLATDQPALTNKLLVTPDSVALPANQSVNVNQLAGTTPDTNSGNKSAGTQRFVLATDQPQLTNALLVAFGKTIKTASVNITADTDIVAAVTSKRIKVIAYALFKTGTNANPIIFKSNGTGGTELARVLLQSQASAVFGANLAISAPSFLFATVAGEKLTMDVGDSDTITGFITYFDDDAT